VIISYYLFPLLAFIPGCMLLYLFVSKHKIKLSPMEIIVLGSVIWNYVLTSFGYMVGILSKLDREFFATYTAVSLLLSVYCGYRLLVRAREVFACALVDNRSLRTHFKISSDKVVLLVSVIPLLAIVFALVISHSVFIEFDAIFTYFPSAKSIVTSGGLQYNYFKLSGLATTDSPAMPIMYAWLMFLDGTGLNFDLGIRVLPFIYVLLTALVIYLISREILEDSNVATIAMLCFLSLPVTLSIVSNFSLYLDIPFVFLLYLAMFVLLKIYRGHNGCYWWFMLGLVISSMLLEKDVAYLLFPSLLILILISLLPRFSKTLLVMSAIVSSLVFAAAYNLLFILDILSHPANLLLGFIFRQIPIIVVCVVFSLFLFGALRNSIFRAPKLSLRCMSVLLLPSMPS